MTCEEIREKISCMLDNELNAEDSAIVMEHLASCPECMSIFEAFHAVSVSLEELEEVPDGFTESVMHQIRITASPKHRRRGLFWLAGMAACLAVVLLAGTGFSSTHQYVDGSDREVAQYVNIMTPPKKLPAVVQPTATILPDVDIVDVTPVPTDAVDEGVIDELSTDPAISPAPTADPTPTPVPTPKPTPKPVVIPIWPMTALTDLLLVVDYADYDLHTGTPDLELDVPDRNGNPVNVCVWMELEHNRLYCKSKDTMTAWYTIGTPKQLLRLMRENKPTPTPTATPTPTPDVVTPTPELVTPTPDVVTPTPEVVSPTPDVVTPTPEVVTPTPDVTVTPVPTTVPDDGIGSGTEDPIESGEAAEEANIAPETE